MRTSWSSEEVENATQKSEGVGAGGEETHTISHNTHGVWRHCCEGRGRGEEINFIACLYRYAFAFPIRRTQCVLGSVLEIDE